MIHFYQTFCWLALHLIVVAVNCQYQYFNSSPHSRRLVASTENFDWKAYLHYNKDLPSQGITTEAAAVSHFISVGHREGRRYNKIMPGMENFDWRSYLQLNPDLYRAGLNTEDHAWQHYTAIGIREGRHCQTTSPVNISLAAGLDKFRAYIQAKKDLEDIPIEKSNLVIYHLEDVESSSNSIAVTFNNVKVFTSAVRRNDLDIFASQNAFYWINVASVSYNPLAGLFPINNPNVAMIYWEIDGGVMNSHIVTLQHLTSYIINDFSAVFFLSSGVRGPFKHRGNGEWLSPYRSLLEPSNVGVVGASAACFPKPHMQTHFFGVKSSIVSLMLASVRDVYMNMIYWTSLDEFFQTQLGDITKKQGFYIASMMHYKRLNTLIFQGDCTNNTRSMEHLTHLASMREWCHVSPSEVNFVRWSGESLSAKGYLCNKAIGTDADSVHQMELEMHKIAQMEPHLNLELSEALTGGMLFDLYHSYNDDFWRLRNLSVPIRTTENTTATATSTVKNYVQPMVCFMVRTSKAHDPLLSLNSKAKYGMIQLDLDGHIRSLLRQTNPNWKAFYFLNEKPSFVKRLLALLSAYNDPRLEFIAVDGKYPNPNGEGSSSSSARINYLLNQLQQRPECRWISLTTATNAYGSEVVNSVLTAGTPIGVTTAPPDLLLVPFDSKYLAKQDYQVRQEERWDQRCLGIEGMLRHNLLSYTIQPVPYPGRIEFSAAFLSRDKIVQDQVAFDMESLLKRKNHNNSSWTAYNSRSVCKGDNFCEDGRVLQHLIRNHLWSYRRLPLDGLKTIVFHENSPTLCIASGNVWFDYPHVGNVGCISHKTLYLLAQKDTSKSAFDWSSFHDGDRLCLRLSSLGFSSRINALRKAVVTTKLNKHANNQHRLLTPSTLNMRNDEKNNAALPDDFDWKEYLTQNPDLQAGGMIFRSAAIEHYLLFGRQEGRPYFQSYSQLDYFDWHSYLELNYLYIANLKYTETGAQMHYKTIGKEQNFPYSPALPESVSWENSINKMNNYINFANTKQWGINSRNLIVFYLEDPESTENSLDVIKNNLRVFIASVLQHSINSPTHAFYLFNVASKYDNSLLDDIPISRSDVAVVRWKEFSTDVYVHMRTVSLLSPALISNFSAIFFTSTATRGPLVFTHNGDWISEFRKLLNEANVGLVGPTVSCQGGPHIQTHFFALRSVLLPYLIEEIKRYRAMTTWLNALEYFEVAISDVVVRAGYKLSSLLTTKRLQTPVFDQNCTIGDYAIPFSPLWDYQSWCEIEPHDVIFMRWGGEPMGQPSSRYLCGKNLDMRDSAVIKMEDMMVDIASLAPKIEFTLPESPFGGVLYDLFKQYREELWQERRLLNNAVRKTGDLTLADSKVCFLVRTSIRDDPVRTMKSKPEMKEMDLGSLIQSMLRQTDPNWIAYFFVTDQVPFENRLRKILSSYGDRRLQFVSISYAHRPMFTRVDAGYTSTDYVTNIIKNKPECRYLSITNGDNVYGSNVVHNVLHYPIRADKGVPPDMLLAPLDSRNFAEHDYHKRQEKELSDRCKGIHAMLEYNLLTYTTQPIPFLGRVDLAAVFLDRRKFAAENVLFGNFTNPKSYPCVGCQDGYLTQYLVRSRRWDYVRMPLDGLRSIVFHGPSPTWCIAAGNVWFDYPHVNKVGCFTHETISYLKQNENPHSLTFDWEHFYAVGEKCLRLSKSGFFNKAIGK